MNTEIETASADGSVIVNRIVRSMKRRRLPVNVELDDLRQVGLIAISGKVGPSRLLARIAWNAMVDCLRVEIRHNRQINRMVGVDKGDVDSYGRPVHPRPIERLMDPFFTLDVKGMEDRHGEWETERAGRGE